MESNFIDRIQFVLKEKRMSQAELAEKLQIRRENFTYWKNNGTCPSSEILFAMADILKVSPRWLVTGDVGPKYNVDLTDEEFRHLDQYCLLSPHEKEIIDDLCGVILKKKSPAGKQDL